MRAMKVQWEMPEDFMQQLDRFAALHNKLSTDRRMSLAEWNSSPSGRQFFARLASDVELRAKPIDEINKLQRQLYLEEVGPPRIGRPRLMEARLAVLREALDAYAKGQLKAVA